METLIQDVRYAVRALLKAPGFMAVAALTLALGIGANTAIFSVVNAVLLTPLPFPQPDRLVMVWERKGASDRNVVSPANFQDWRERATSFAGLAAEVGAEETFTGDVPEHVQGRAVTPDYFSVLGVTPELGHMFTAEESRPGGPPVVVLSDWLWRRRFNADRNIVGRTIPTAGGSVTVAGVMPPSLEPLMPLLDQDCGYWEPLRLDPARPRAGRYALAVARLKTGVSVERAQTEMAGIARSLEREYPDFDTGWSVNVVPLTEQVVGASRRMLWIMLGAVALVLLIACANVANLTLVRAASRQHELALRTALGAPRWRLLRQVLAESVLLGLTGGLLGLLLALWGVPLLVAAAPGVVPRLGDVRLDLRVLSFTAAASLVVAMLFGLPAALRTHVGAVRGLAAAGRTTADAASSRLRGALVVTQVSLAIVLLVGAGLLLRSLRELAGVDPGFDATNVMSVDINLPATYPDSTRQVAFFGRLLERVRATPSIQGAGLVSWLPFAWGNSATRLRVMGRPEPAPGQWPSAAIRIADPGYFDLMRIPLVRGRSLSAADGPGAPRVAVISELLARRLWPGENPVGQFVRVSWWHPDADVEIVGVVGDVKHDGLDADAFPTLYFPYGQEPQPFLRLVVRSSLGAAGVTTLVRAAARELDRNVPTPDAVRLEQLMSASLAGRRYPMTLLLLFAALAVTLAAVGIYGVLSYLVGQRSREIGIRMALGAAPSDVLRTVVGGGLGLTLGGVAIGSLAAALASRALGRLLFGVHPVDPLTYGLVGLLLVAVALAATALPARRAARTDPMIALRSE